MADMSKRLGLLVPPPNTTLETEFHRWTPEGVTVHTARMRRSSPDISIEMLLEMADSAGETASRLAMAQVEVILFGCTSGSLLMGVEWERQLTDRLHQTTGIPIVTTSGAVVEALRTLEIRNVAVVTPYVSSINERVWAFLEECGFRVVSLESPEHDHAEAIAGTTQEQIYDLARKADRREADGIFISCTNFPAMGVVERIERDFGKPVVSSNQASLWLALRRLGVEDPVPGLGRLLRKPVGQPVGS